MRTKILLCVAVSLLTLGCAAPSTPAAPTPTVLVTPPATATSASSAAQATATATSSGAAPRVALRDALTTLDIEVRAIQSAATIADAKRHAEAAQNVLVGQYGRWYGDADGDGTVNDPLHGLGILPGEKVPGPAPDVGSPVFPYGLALLAYSAGTDTDKPVIAGLLGNLSQWQTSPRSGYDAINTAVTSADPQGASLAKLPGSLPRIVADLRLVLTKATSSAGVKPFVDLAAADSSAALAAISKIQP